MNAFGFHGPVIFRNALLAAMSAGDLIALGPSLVEAPLGLGQVLYEPGVRDPQVYFPSSAVVSVATVMDDGVAVETATIGHESAVGLLSALSGEPARCRVSVQIAGGAIRAPAHQLRAQAHTNSDLMTLLLRSILADSARADLSLACNSLHEASRRLARWLLETSERIGSPLVPLTQEHLATMLGVQRTTVSATASTLRDQGLIRYSRGQVQLIDRPGLERASCACYAASRQISRAGEAIARSSANVA